MAFLSPPAPAVRNSFLPAAYSINRRSTRPSPRCTAALTRTHVHLPSRDISLELLSAPASPAFAQSLAPPLLFVHGSLHAAWCYERFLTRLAAVDSSRAAAAVSLRGYTSSPPPAPGAVLAVDDHVADLCALLTALPGLPPVVVAHSIGGFYAQRAVGMGADVAGLVLLASYPPSGGSKLVWRTVGRVGVRMAWRITMGFVRATVTTDVSVARDMFFTRPGKRVDEAVEGDGLVLQWMEEFAKARESRLDTRSIAPIKDAAIADGMEGRVLVCGGADDLIVDGPALEETAAFWRCSAPPTALKDCPHDMMLATNWDHAFDAVHRWIRDDLPVAMKEG